MFTDKLTNQWATSLLNDSRIRHGQTLTLTLGRTADLSASGVVEQPHQKPLEMDRSLEIGLSDAYLVYYLSI